MVGGKRYISLKTKIMTSILIPVVVSFAVIGAVIFILLFSSLQKTAEARFLQVSQKYAHSFESKINNAMNYLSIVTSEVEGQRELGAVDRESLQKILLGTFDEYELIDGSSIYFEADMYDGRDAEYIGSDYGTSLSGRICWYFYKDGSETAYLPEGLEGDIEFELPHYAEAKKANKPIYTDPVVYEINGKDIPMFTFTYPINDSGGNFIGAVTVDMFIDDIYTQLQNEDVYETGYVIIANDADRIIYSPFFDNIGKTREEAGLNYELSPEGKTPDFIRTESIVNGKNTLVTIETVYIPRLDSSFYISVLAPVNEINAEAARMMVIFGILSLLIVAAIAVLLYNSIGKISSPLNDITEGINKIAGGNYGTRIGGYYKGEFAVVKDSINKMADSIEKYTKESENSLNILESILNGLDAYIYATVPDTGEILFINDQMREHYAIEDKCVGRICYEVLQDGMSEKCEFCPCHTLDKGEKSFVVWEEHSTLTKRHYRNTDRYIDWLGGKKAHLQHSVDITDIKETQAALDRRLRQQSLMASISQSFLSDESIDVLIANALHMAGDFIDVAQILLYEFEEDEVTLTCKNEWINPEAGKQTRIGDKMALEDTMLSVIKELSDDMDFCLSSNDPIMKAAMAPYRVNFQNFITTPIYLKGEMYGALDFSRSDDGRQWSESDITLASLLSSLLSGVFERHSMELELISAKDLAEQGSRSKSEFLSRMSHEIRTPMNAIIGMTSIAKNADDSQKKDYCLDKIDDASQHLLGVINDILDMSKIEANKFELSVVEFSFEKMLQKVVNVNNFRIDEKHQNFSVFIDKNIPQTLFGDDQRLSQVITNLLSNAVKFTPEQGSIRLNTRLLGKEENVCTIQIDVTDTGIGISEEQKSRIFSSFEQAENSTSRKFGGTGLGLAISKHIIEMMGGTVWIDSEIGNGSTFSFTVKTGYSREERHYGLGTGVNWKSIRVLAVDDMLEIRDYFADIASRIGIACDTAGSGEEALERIRSDGPYNLYFVDWQMPGMDGIELSRRIKSECEGDAVVIMISATEWSVIEDDAKSVGVDKFLAKPLFPSSIVDCINECLQAGAMPSAEDLPVEEADCFEEYCVLLAEDVEINREIVLAMLEPTALKIDFAENGKEAVRLFSSAPERYDLIFMDVQMPEMDGYGATRLIRSLDVPEAKTVPIVAMTANVFREDIEKCLAEGMNDHIGKPIDIESLLEKLRKYLK